MNKPLKIFGLVLVIIGLLLLNEKINFLQFGIKYVIFVGMIVGGFYWFYKVIETRKRYQIFFSVVLFLFGILYLLTSIYDINITSRVLFFSSFFSFGSALLMIYLKERHIKWFLVIAVSLIIFSILPFLNVFTVPMIYNINISDILTYWPFLIIFFGILYLLRLDYR